METATLIGLIVAALVGAGTTIWATNEQNKANAAAGSEAKGLALLNRSDQLGAQQQQYGFSLKSLSEQVASRKQNQQQFNQSLSEQKRQFNEQKAMSVVKNIQDMADKSADYRKELVQLWGV
jgi:hypothetical protein